MSWEKEVEELRRRKALARQMGGSEGIERQHKRGKLTVRERIDKFVDPGSFSEYGGLSGSATYEGSELKSFIPKASVEGICRLNGRKAILTAGDFTVRGGSGGAGGGLGSELASNRRAMEWRIPYVRLLDAAGGSVRSFEQMGRTYLPDGNGWSTVDADLLNYVPVVTLALNPRVCFPA